MTDLLNNKMKKIIPKDCLDCPFCRNEHKAKNGWCWYYMKTMKIKANEKQKFCLINEIIVKES